MPLSRYVTKETIRGSGDLLVDGGRVAEARYSLTVQEREEEFNGMWLKAHSERFTALSITPTEIDDPAALALGSELVLRLDDGRQLPVMIAEMDREPDGTPMFGFVVAGGWL